MTSSSSSGGGGGGGGMACVVVFGAWGFGWKLNSPVTTSYFHVGPCRPGTQRDPFCLLKKRNLLPLWIGLRCEKEATIQHFKVSRWSDWLLAQLRLCILHSVRLCQCVQLRTYYLRVYCPYMIISQYQYNFEEYQPFLNNVS
jgi:hypothetical protein